MSCDNIVGVKNIMISFFNCNTNTRIGPISHELATDEIPTWKTCPYTSEALPGGYVKRKYSMAGAAMKIIRDKRIPLSYYQGCVAIDLQVEMENGIVYTALNGGITGDAKSDSHQVDLELTFKSVDEMLPPGALASAA